MYARASGEAAALLELERLGEVGPCRLEVTGVLVRSGEVGGHLTFGDDRPDRAETFTRTLGTLHGLGFSAEAAERGRRVRVRQGRGAHVVRSQEQLPRLVEVHERALAVVVVHRVDPRRDQDPALLAR